MKKILKMIGLTIGGIILLFVLVVTLFVNLSPQFGRGPSAEQKVAYENGGHYKNGKFLNIPTVDMNFNIVKVLKAYANSPPDRRPPRNISVEQVDSAEISNRGADIAQLTWFGHSAFLLEMDGQKVLIDPMLGNTPTPHPWLGTTRYSDSLPIEIDKLPLIDFVVISHDHYDHLDYGSIQKLKDKAGEFIVPLGVGNHLIEWGVPAENIRELNWGDVITSNGIELACTPARHFSGRGILDRQTTLWCSWVIKGKSQKIFFSGDSGYGDHFKEIGEKHGPFDIALMECGQYNENWSEIHMMPEETAQAGLDLKSKLIMPIHWGAFTLSLHKWNDPILRVTAKAAELNILVTTPKIGEVVVVGDANYPKEKWWESYTKN